MSLKDLAQQMKATGRKGDTELVHMTKGEVAGLQALAKAAGGTLTINPKTGLPEASFLEQLLPTIIGMGVGFATMNPYAGAAAGAAVGGAQNKDNPLMGALMGGLGGYGGAGLGAGFAGGSAAGAAGTAGTAAPAAGAAPVATPVTTSSIAATTPTGPGGLDLLTPTASATPTIATAPTAATATTPAQSGGISSLLNAQGLKYGAMAASPMLLAPTGEQAEMPTEEKDEEDLFGRYEYRANPTGGIRTPGSAFTGERVFFQPEYRRMFAAKGGEVKKFADGGEAAAPSSEAMADGFDPARGMTGMSRDAMMYLYGLTPESRGDVPEAVTDYVAPEIRFNPYRAPAASSGGGGGGGGGIYTGGFGGAGGGGGDFGYNPNQDFGYYSGYSPSINYGVPVSDALVGTVGPGGSVSWGATVSPVSDYGSVVGTSLGSLGGGYDSGISGGYDSSPGGGFDAGIGGFFAEGGLASLAKGGMKAGGFVVPADVVSMVGEGNTDAGYERIKRMLPGATPIKGKDGGQADTVKTSIEGKQPARIAHGEMYVPPASVKRAGGAKKLYAMMDKVRKQATGNKKQIKPVNLKKALA